MRILQIHTHYRQAGGEDAVAAAEAALLRSAGHDVVEHREENPASARGAVAALAAAPWNPAAARRVAEAAHEANADVAHLHNTWFALSPSVAGALRSVGLPVVMTLHNYRVLCANAQLYRDGRPCELCVGSHPWHGVVHACYRDSHVQSIPAAVTVAVGRRQWPRHVDVFCALSDFAKDRFVAGGIPADQIVVKPNAVVDPGPRSAPPSASRDVLYVGRLAPEKGVDVVLAAFSAMDRQGLRLVVIGDGPERGRLEALAGPAVRFEGRLLPAAVRERMLAARALVFPSTSYETFGLSVAEGLAAGLPAVASRLGGTPEVVGPGGWLVEPGDVASWAQALERLADDGEVDAVGAAGRSHWAARFSPAVVLPILEGIYERARDRASAQRDQRSSA